MDETAGEFKFRWSTEESERFKGKILINDNLILKFCFEENQFSST